jgi:cysteinyl-tRNA synthetase
VRKFDRYGELSKRDVDDLLSGARIDPTELKDDPLDFALWKGAKPGEPSWESPWGPGRPGWHIECSAMALENLGEQIDIHGGGADLIFPHHTNEIAQTEAYTGQPPFARIWMHNALLQLGSEKMSKSIGNLVTIKQALEQFGPDALRLFVITSHYRSPASYSEEALEAARAGAERLRNAAFVTGGEGTPEIEPDRHRERFIEAMDDDLNTPRALAVLFELARDINRAATAGQDISGGQALFRELCGVLGLTLQSPAREAQEAAPFIDLLVTLRTELRAAKQWAIADQVRDGLTALGVEIKDGPEGTAWSLK